MNLIITITKEVPDEDTAQNLYDIVKERLLPYPEIQTTAFVSKQLDLD